MPERVKYPLTPEAKEAAKALVEAWDLNQLDQMFDIGIMRGDGEEHWLMFDSDFDVPPKSSFYELAAFKLIRLQYATETTVEILLLQELRNAVENNFAVSDYFLTLNAVGTIVYGNLEVKEGAVFQSAAAHEGNIIQNTALIADQLEDLLGDDVLSDNEDLRTAIQELRNADEPSRLQKMGKVVAELGRCLEHIGNTGAAIAAIGLMAKILGG